MPMSSNEFSGKPKSEYKDICPHCNEEIEDDEESITVKLHRNCSDEIHLTDKY